MTALVSCTPWTSAQFNNNTGGSLGAITTSNGNTVVIASSASTSGATFAHSQPGTIQTAVAEARATSADYYNLRYVENIAGSNAHTVTITTAASTWSALHAVQLSGVAWTSALDQIASGSGTDTTNTFDLQTSAVATTAQADELAVVAGGIATNHTAAANSWTGQNSYIKAGETVAGAAGSVSAIATRILTATGTPTGDLRLTDATGLAGGSGAWLAQVATFKKRTSNPTINDVREMGGTATGTAGTTSVIGVGGIGVPIGDWVVVFVGCDNSGAAGIAPTLSCTDSAGNTYTAVGTAAIANPGSAVNSGCVAQIFIGKITTAIASGGNVTVTYGTSTTVRCCQAEHWQGFKVTGTVVSATVANNLTGTSTSISRTPTAANQLVLCLLAVEGATSETFTEDSDTTDGTWRTIARRGSGAGAAGVTIRPSYKLVTGTSAQTWNPVMGTSADHCAVMAVIDWETSAGSSTAVTFASETDTAQPINELKTKAIGFAEIVAAAQVINIQRRVALTLAAETDTAIAIGHRLSRPVIAALEVDTAQVITKAKRKAVTNAAEVDTAQVIGRVRQRAVVNAAEVDTAIAVGWRRRKDVTIALEVDSASGISHGGKVVSVGTAEIVAAAQPITRRKAKLLGLATELDTGLVIGKAHTRTVIVAAEVDAAQAIVKAAKTKLLGLALEVDEAGVIVRSGVQTPRHNTGTVVGVTLTQPQSVDQ